MKTVTVYKNEGYVTKLLRNKGLFFYWVAGTKSGRLFQKVFVKHVYGYGDGYRNEKRSNCSTDTIRIQVDHIPDIIKILQEMYMEVVGASPVEIVDGKVTVVSGGKKKEPVDEADAILREIGGLK